MIRHFKILFFLTTLGLMMTGNPALSQTLFWVTNNLDKGPGSLREMIDAASSGDTIRFAPDVHNVNLKSGELLLTQSLTIIGNQDYIEIKRDTTTEFRIMEINGNGFPIRIMLKNIAIINGQTKNYNDEPLPGGGIYIPASSDSLFMDSCRVAENLTGKAQLGYGNLAGSGGGIFNTGYLSLQECIIENNKSGDGMTFSDAGSGGGIYNEGTVRALNCIFRLNQSGIGGNGWAAGGASAVGKNGGDGGAICNINNLFISNSEFSNNESGSGGYASANYHSTGYGGTGGRGGVLYNGGYAEFVSCTIRNNNTGNGGWATYDGRSGSGGAIYNVSDLKILNCLITDNETGSTYSGAEGCYPGNGGAIYSKSSGNIKLINTTVSNNRIRAGSSGSSVTGGGLFIESGQIELINSIVAGNFMNGNVPEDIAGSVKARYSIIKNIQHATITGTSSFLGVDPQFMLDGYDYHIRAASIACDGGNPDTTGLILPVTDIGNRNRIYNGIVDIGAYERQMYEVSYIVEHPDSIRFPLIPVNTFSIDSITLEACSDIPFTLDSIVSDGNFLLSTDLLSGWLPSMQNVVLSPGVNKVYVRFSPNEEGVFSRDIRIYNEDSLVGALIIPVSGESTWCTLFSGKIDRDTTWQGCIRLTGNVTIGDQVKLSIKPGTRIISEGPFEVFVDGGCIYAAGNRNHRIEFTGKPVISGTDTLYRTWKGIRINSGYYGADTLFFDYCTFQNGYTVNVNEGGGVVFFEHQYWPGKTTFSNCIFKDNIGYDGGAIREYGGNEYDIYIINTVFENNTAINQGGAIYVSWRTYYEGYHPLTVINTLFRNNRSGNKETGSAVHSNHFDKFINCSFIDNLYPQITGTCDYLVNCLFWPAKVDHQYLIWPLLLHTNKDFSYPDFADSTNYNYRLLSSSNCVDAGGPDTIAFPLPAFDMDGRRRVAGARVDIGCYETQEQSPAIISAVPSALDLYTQVNYPVVYKSLVIKNTGNDLLEVFSISLPEGFDILNKYGEWVNPCGELNINIDDSIRLDLRFLPTENKQYSGILVIDCNDPNNQSVVIPLTGHISGEGAEETGTELFEPSIYPVPTHGTLYLSNLNNISRIEISDIHGCALINLLLDPQQKTFKLDMGSLPKGIYFVRMFSYEKVIIRKVILN